MFHVVIWLSLLLTFGSAAFGQESPVISEYFPGSEPIDIDAFIPYNTTFEPFGNEGGPIDLHGALYQKESGYIGMILPTGALMFVCMCIVHMECCCLLTANVRCSLLRH